MAIAFLAIPTNLAPTLTAVLLALSLLIVARASVRLR